MTSLHFKKNLEEIALSNGFSAVGITSPDFTDVKIKKRLELYIKNNWHADMKWLEKRIEARSSPKILWPDVKSVLVFTDDYSPDHNPLKKLKRTEVANISVYASGRDYHKVVKAKLKKIGAWVVKNLDCEIKLFVDTAPVMEKPLAQKAGLGWQGKHTNLVSKKTGNWFFLGFIFLNKKLEADTPETDHCGSCKKCLDICPTDAFEGPYKLDSRRCIAYLTIEHHGAVSEELRNKIGNRIFGCDDCLAICPWNKYANISNNMNYEKILADLPLEKAVQFSDAEFRKFFSGTSIKRLGVKRFLRNVLYAIGNSKRREYIPIIKPLQNSQTDYIVDAANWAIEMLRKNNG